MRVTAVIYFRVVDPNKSVIEVENHVLATSQISQTTLRSVLGEKSLDDLLTNREAINEQLQKIIDDQTEPWGVKVSVVEVKDVEIPHNMQRAMARQAESERERRAKVIAAEGEYQASQRLRQAADRLENPTALQLRLFQTMGEIATEQNSTIILPIPLDLFRPYLNTSTDGHGFRHTKAKKKGRGKRGRRDATRRSWETSAGGTERGGSYRDAGQGSQALGIPTEGAEENMRARANFPSVPVGIVLDMVRTSE